MSKLAIKRSVLKDLRSLPKDVRGRAALSILELSTSPSPPKTDSSNLMKPGNPPPKDERQPCLAFSTTSNSLSSPY